MQFLRESMLTRYLYCLKVKNCYGTATKTDTIDKQNKIESPEVNPHTNGQLIYDKGGKNTQWTVCSVSGARKTGQPHIKQWNQNIL